MIIRAQRRRVEEVYRKADDLIAKHANKNSCSAGCAHCCKQFITISKLEAEMIVDYLFRNNIKIDPKKLQAQCEAMFEIAQTNIDPKINFNWFDRGEDCVLLGKDKRCLVYPVRPMSCRSALSLGDPEDCNAATKEIKLINTSPVKEFIVRELIHESRMTDLDWSFGPLPIVLWGYLNGNYKRNCSSRATQQAACA